MQADQVIWFVAGAIAVLAALFVIRLFRQPQADRMTPETPVERSPSPPIGFSGQVPYGVDKRPMPSGDDLDVLLPVQMGSFVSVQVDVPPNV